MSARALAGNLSDEVLASLSSARVPTAVVGVVSPGEIAVDRYGSVAPEADAPPSIETLFAIGSITQSFTAAAVLLLRDQGRLNLDDPVHRHIPEFAAVVPREGAPDAITLRHVLRHRAGLPNSSPAHFQRGRSPEIDDVIASLPETTIVGAPGGRFTPSGLGYALLGEVIRRRSGQTYEVFVKAELFDPLGIESTVFDIPDELRQRLAAGYEVRPFEDELLQVPEIEVAAGRPSDGAYSTFEDLAVWVRFLLGTGDRDGRVGLSQASRRELLDARVSRPGDAARVAMPWVAEPTTPELSLSIVAGFIGYLSQVELLPDRRHGVIVLTNLHGHSSTSAIVEAVRAHPSPSGQGESRSRALPPPSPTPAAYRDYLGLYLRDEGIPGREGRFGRVEFREGRLLLVRLDVRGTGGFPSPLASSGEPDVFRPLAGYGVGEDLRFSRDEDGSVLGFVLEPGAEWTKLVGAV